MPYSDIGARRRVQREAQARRRAAARASTGQEGLTSTPVNPANLPPPAPPTAVDIHFAARLLNVVPQRGDTPERFHTRVREQWRRLLRAVEG